MIEAYFIPFATILVAEFLDKSQLSVLLLATRTKNHVQLLLGVTLAFLIVDGSAILFGTLLTTVLPENVLQIISGVLFLLFGVLSLRDAQQEEKKHKKHLSHPLLAGFVMVFVSEWGDKTQLTSAIFASRYDPVFVLLGVMSALFLLSFLAITVGNRLLKTIPAKTMHTLAGILFILLGVFFVFF